MSGQSTNAGRTARKILHLDLDAFFCAVEEQRDPALQGKAFAVGGRPDQRGVVASCSYAARRFGVRSAMPMARALRLCPELIVTPSNFKAYHEASARVMDVLHNTTPDVEQISIDEAFLDVTLLPDAAETIARRLQATIHADLGLPSSLGVATNKLVAKIANNIGKAGAVKDSPPFAITVVPPGQEAAFLAPLAAGELWGVGPKTAEQLGKLGIHTIGELARWSETDLIRRFGKQGADLARRARGMDDSPVAAEGEAKSVSKETTFAHDVRDGHELRRTLLALSDEVGRRLRRDGLRGVTIKIKLRWADFTTLTRQVTLDQPTHHDRDIYEAALALFERTWPEGRPVRLIGVGVSGFDDPGEQLGLWGQVKAQQDERLESTLDALRDRFGERIVRRGSQLRSGDDDE